MTQADAQLMALKEARDRVLKVYGMMVPLIENLALEGDSLAKYLIAEHNKAQDTLSITNLDAANFVEERTDG